MPKHIDPRKASREVRAVFDDWYASRYCERMSCCTRS